LECVIKESKKEGEEEEKEENPLFEMRPFSSIETALSKLKEEEEIQADLGQKEQVDSARKLFKLCSITQKVDVKDQLKNFFRGGGLPSFFLPL